MPTTGNVQYTKTELENKTKVQLTKIAQELGMSGYSKLNKDPLIDAITLSFSNKTFRAFAISCPMVAVSLLNSLDSLTKSYSTSKTHLRSAE